MIATDMNAWDRLRIYMEYFIAHLHCKHRNGMEGNPIPFETFHTKINGISHLEIWLSLHDVPKS